MVIKVNRTTLASSTSGGILKSGNDDALLSFISDRLLERPGFIEISGIGKVTGGSNPSNVLADELSINILKPFLSQSSDILFSKVFTGPLIFDFSLKYNKSTNKFHSKFLFSDGTTLYKEANVVINFGTGNIGSYCIGLEHTSVSGLYNIQVHEFKTQYSPNSIVD